jgi:hypothetical protein
LVAGAADPGGAGAEASPVGSEFGGDDDDEDGGGAAPVDGSVGGSVDGSVGADGATEEGTDEVDSATLEDGDGPPASEAGLRDVLGKAVAMGLAVETGTPLTVGGGGVTTLDGSIAHAATIRRSNAGPSNGIARFEFRTAATVPRVDGQAAAAVPLMLDSCRSSDSTNP